MPTALFCGPLPSDLAHDLFVCFDLLGGFLLALPFSHPPSFTQCGTRMTDAAASAFGLRNGSSADQRTATWIMPLPHNVSETHFQAKRQMASA